MACWKEEGNLVSIEVKPTRESILWQLLSQIDNLEIFESSHPIIIKNQDPQFHLPKVPNTSKRHEVVK